MSHADPYADYPAQNASQPTSGDAMDVQRGRSRSRSPVRNGSASYRSPRSPPAGGSTGGREGYRRKSSPPPRKPNHAPANPAPSRVLGVFGLSIRTQERDLEDEFGRFGTVEKVTIVYDQRTDRSRGFGFIVMATEDDASRCVTELNGLELNGRRIRVDFSVTERPHAPTPGEYMGLRRSNYSDRRDDRGHGGGYHRRGYDRDRGDRGSGRYERGGDRYSDRYDDRRDDHRRDDYRRGDDRREDRYRDDRRGGDDHRRGGGGDDRRSSPPARRRSYSRSPPRREAREAASPGARGFEHNGEPGPRW